MIVAALVLAALLADRFLLLPGFEDGRSSGLVVGGLWLAVNLLPAVAWLILHRADPDLDRSQQAQGALAVVVVTALGILPVLIWYGSTGAPLN